MSMINTQRSDPGRPEGDPLKSKRARTVPEGPNYHGVRMRAWGKWVSEIREPKTKSRIWLDTFDSPEMAARAHGVAALSIKGETALLNFPGLAVLLPRSVTLSPSDIRDAANKAAAMHEFDSGTAPEPSSTVESKTGVLTEIIELPILEPSYSYETLELRTEFVCPDSVDRWVYPPAEDSHEGEDILLWDWN